jgi:hypothetical protein
VITGLVCATLQVGVRVTSNSWGASERYQYGEPDCYLWDAYGWEQQDMLHVFAAGNEGSLQALKRTSGTASSPATCKNVLSVGATEVRRVQRINQ